MEEGHDEEDNDMRGTSGSHDFFETESVNWFDGWSISFQTVHDKPEKRRVTVNQGLIFGGRLTLSGIQLKT